MPPVGELGTLVRNRRHELSLTLEALGASVGCTAQAISLIELGKRSQIGAVNARRLARALGIDHDLLLDLLEDNPAAVPA
jgi:transcriptional regulator with XRE-family HTH domain